MSETPKVRCPKCGARVPAYYLVCPYCGANLTERPVLVADVRDLGERIRSLYKALSTLNFETVLKLLLVPVRSMSLISSAIIALGLALPTNLGPLGEIVVFIFRALRLILIRSFIELYVAIISVKKMGDRDVMIEILELGGLWLLPFSFIAFYTHELTYILGLIVIIYTAAALFRYYQLGKLRERFLIPVLALIVFLGFLALRFLLSFLCSPWRT